jgi:branched-chain amino acid transport system ATP-binding protein
MTELLSVEQVTCRFGRLAALDGVSLAVPVGQRHALIGPNGAGKTTLLSVVAGTIGPTRGTVRLDGRDITRAGPARRSRLGIARTFQTPALASSLTALENVAVGAWWHTEASARPARHPHLAVGRPSRRRVATVRALRQLDQLGLGHLAGVPAGQLSHGRRRLLEIGVALVARPRLLVLDEPAAGLADADLPALMRCLTQLSRDVTVLLAEHHMDLVTAVADVVTVLHQGTVLAHGTPAQISTHPGVAEVYLGTSPTRLAVT